MTPGARREALGVTKPFERKQAVLRSRKFGECRVIAMRTRKRPSREPGMGKQVRKRGPPVDESDDEAPEAVSVGAVRMASKGRALHRELQQEADGLTH